MPIDATQLLALESNVRRVGSDLGSSELRGCWRLQQVWSKGSLQPAAPSALLLRSLGARLEIAGSDQDLQVINRVNLGHLELRFVGNGRLQGRRPLLLFWFERLELRLAGLVLLQRPLLKPAQQRLPFFALIARDPSGWLAARGRGGGLALWRLESTPDAK